MKQTKITDYTPDPANPNKHTQRGVSMLEDSIASVGLGRSIVVDKNGIVLAGNSTQERAVDQGFEDAIEVESDGTRLVVVRRTDLDLLGDEMKARALTYYDNRTAQTGIDFDVERLLADINAGLDVSKMWLDWELDKLQIAPDSQDDYAAQWAGMPEFEQEDLTSAYAIKVHFNTFEDMQAFAELINQTLTENTKSIWHPAKERERLTDKAWKSES